MKSPPDPPLPASGNTKVSHVVKVTMKHRVLPYPPYHSSHQTINLGALDHVTAPLMIIQMPFLFKQSLEPDRMVAALAAALHRFPLFAGRLRTDPSNGNCQVVTSSHSGEGGASLVIATCESASVESLVPSDAITAAITSQKCAWYTPPDLSSFLPTFPLSMHAYRDRDVPLLHAQLTLFSHCNGCVLKVAVPHLIADQETCRTLLRAWAQEYTHLCTLKSVKSAAAAVVIDIEAAAASPTAAVIKPPSLSDIRGKPINLMQIKGESEEKIENAALDGYATPELPLEWVSSRFELRTWMFYPKIMCQYLYHVLAAGGIDTVAYYVPQTRLASLKAEASAYSSAARSTWISSNDALAARICQMLAQIPEKKAGGLQLQLWVNLRKRLAPPLDDEVLGNCSWTVAVVDSISDSSNDTENNHNMQRSSSSSSSVSSSDTENTGGAARNTTATTTTTTDHHQMSLDLGKTAAAIRSSLHSIDSSQAAPILNELRWLKNNLQCGGARMPVVFKGAGNVLYPEGPVMLSHWDWGGNDYADLSFGGGKQSTPVWHQPPLPKVPNCIFVVPAAAAAGAAGQGRGVVVHITLHRKSAAALRELCPVL